MKVHRVGGGADPAGNVGRGERPGGSPTAAEAGPRVEVRPNPVLQAMAAATRRDRLVVREAMMYLALPQPQFARFLLEQATNDPNARMARLLNESEDLRQAREEIRRFWMNNKPSVLTADRLNGAIGP